MMSDHRRILLLELVVVASIALLGTVLRMAWPDLTEFKADEARLYVLALEMSQGKFALRGISSSVGFPNFPMSVWLYSLPLLIWPHPYSATLFTGLLNSMAMLGAYWLVRRYWGKTAAIATLLLLAVSPWAIIYSRKIWAQNLLPLFVILWGVSAIVAFVDERRRWVIPHLVSLAVAVQIHLAAIALVPATLLFMIVFRRRLSWSIAIVGVALALLTAAPFLYYLVQSGTALPALEGETDAPATRLSIDSVRYVAMISTGSDIHSLAGPTAFEAYLDGLPPMWPVYLAWGGLVLAGVGLLFWQMFRNWRDRQTQAGFVLLGWLLVPVLVFTWTWTASFPHYFIATFPAQYMIAGVAFAAGTLALGMWGRVVAWTLLLATAAAQVYAWLALLSLLATQATPGGFGTPLGMKLAAAEAARAAVSGGASEVVIAGEGASPRVASFPAEYDALLFDVPRRFVDLSTEALFPGQAAVVLADGALGDDSSMVGAYLEAADRLETFPRRMGEAELLLMTIPAAAAPEPAIRIEPPNLLANWVRLFGAEWQHEPGTEQAYWRLHWTPGENPDPAIYHLFSHAIGPEGERLAQDDQPAFDGAQWRPGDVVISQFALDGLAGEPVLVRSGMYRYPSLEAVPVLDAAANPAGDAVEILLPSE